MCVFFFLCFVVFLGCKCACTRNDCSAGFEVDEEYARAIADATPTKYMKVTVEVEYDSEYEPVKSTGAMGLSMLCPTRT